MQALRTSVLAQGSLQAIRGGTRASTGRGWYQRYQRMGPDAFRKARAPNPFDWDESSPAATATAPDAAGAAAEERQGESGRRRPRRRAFFDMSVDGVPAGRVEFELASDVLPVTSENFLRLCNGVTVASAAGEATLLRRQEQSGGGAAAEEEAVEEEEEEEELGYEGSVVSAAFRIA